MSEPTQITGMLWNSDSSLLAVHFTRAGASETASESVTLRRRLIRLKLHFLKSKFGRLPTTTGTSSKKFGALERR